MIHKADTAATRQNMAAANHNWAHGRPPLSENRVILPVLPQQSTAKKGEMDRRLQGYILWLRTELAPGDGLAARYVRAAERHYGKFLLTRNPGYRLEAWRWVRRACGRMVQLEKGGQP
jgi:hypothetical protein